MDRKYNIKIEKILPHRQNFLHEMKESQIIERIKINDEDLNRSLEYLENIADSLSNAKGGTLRIKQEQIRKIFADSITPESPLYTASESWIHPAVFIITLGASIDELLHRLNYEKKFLYLQIADQWANTLLENLANFIQKQWALTTIEEIRNSAQKLGACRYSPGHCGWHIDGQYAIMGYMGDLNVYVNLKEGPLLYPTKSLTGIFALEETPAESLKPLSCQNCTRECTYRKILKQYEKILNPMA